MFDYSLKNFENIPTIELQVVYLPNPEKRRIWQRIYYHVIYFWEIITKLKSTDIIFLQTTQSFVGFFRDLPIFLFTPNQKKVIQILGGFYGELISSQPNWLKKYIIKGLSNADILLVETEATKNSFKFSESIFKKLEVIPNGVQINLENKENLSIPNNNSVHILFLSSMIKEKGYDDVLEATEILRSKHNIKAEVTFVGPFLFGGENEFLTKIKYKNYINYYKSKLGSEKTELYLKSHFFILPSYYVNEGQPLALLEAMGHGCVCLATNYRGIASTIEDSITGVFVEPKNPSDISEKILQLINSSKYELIRNNAILKIGTFHTNKSFEKSFIQIISRLL